MPLVEIPDYSETQLTVDFGKGSTITFKMKPGSMTFQMARRLSQQYKRAEWVGKRITAFEDRIATAKNEHEFDGLMKDLENLMNRDDGLNVMSSYILECAEGWTDYYRTPDDQAADRLLPFTKEVIERVHPTRLLLILQAFNAHFGLEETEAKKLNENSQSDSEIPTEALAVSPSSISSTSSQENTASLPTK